MRDQGKETEGRNRRLNIQGGGGRRKREEGEEDRDLRNRIGQMEGERLFLLRANCFHKPLSYFHLPLFNIFSSLSDIERIFPARFPRFLLVHVLLKQRQEKLQLPLDSSYCRTFSTPIATREICQYLNDKMAHLCAILLQIQYSFSRFQWRLTNGNQMLTTIHVNRPPKEKRIGQCLVQVVWSVFDVGFLRTLNASKNSRLICKNLKVQSQISSAGTIPGCHFQANQSCEMVFLTPQLKLLRELTLGKATLLTASLQSLFRSAIWD